MEKYQIATGPTNAIVHALRCRISQRMLELLNVVLALSNTLALVVVPDFPQFKSVDQIHQAKVRSPQYVLEN